MNPQNLTKIKQLINTAPILTAPEREEWSVLLDLMDERQLKELEGILGTGIKNNELRSKEEHKPVSQQVSLLASKPVSNLASQNPLAEEKKPAIPPPPKIVEPVKPPITPIPKPQMPNLSHIMNLPRVGEVNKSANQQISKSAKPIGISPQDLVRKLLGKKNPRPDLTKQNLFANHLKQTVTEKELPAAKQFLELPKPPLPKKNPVLPQIVKPQVDNSPVLGKEVPVALLKPVLLQSPPASGIENKPSIVPKPLFPLKPLLNLRPLPQKPGAVFVPGLNIQRGSVKSNQDTLDNIKQHVQSRQEKTTSISHAAPIIQNIVISNLKDLTLLTAKSLEDWDLEVMVSKIKSFESTLQR